MKMQTELPPYSMFGKLIMKITYGIDVSSSDDPYISIAQKALYAITVAGNVGTYLVDSIPARMSPHFPLPLVTSQRFTSKVCPRMVPWSAVQARRARVEKMG